MTHRISKLTGAFAAALVVLAAGLAPAAVKAPAAKPAAAPSAAPAAPAEAQAFDAASLADQALGHVRVRLKLTNSQIVRIRPLLMDTMTKLRQTLIDYSSPDGVMI